MAQIVTTVDAVHGARTLADHAESVKQLAVADRIVLTKTDIADASVIASVTRRIQAINPSAPILRNPDASSLLDESTLQRDAVTQSWFDQQMQAGDTTEHLQNIRAFAIVFDHGLDWTLFSLWLTMLLNRHGDSLLRVKGILNVAGSEAPVAIHGVQHLVHPPVHMLGWPDDDRRSRIVFIVKDLDPIAIERSFAAFCGDPLGRRQPGCK
jgi:G3E family GTPase